jgi:hypothetical protein
MAYEVPIDGQGRVRPGLGGTIRVELVTTTGRGREAGTQVLRLPGGQTIAGQLKVEHSSDFNRDVAGLVVVTFLASALNHIVEAGE